jgi:hypothetical protein
MLFRMSDLAPVVELRYSCKVAVVPASILLSFIQKHLANCSGLLADLMAEVKGNQRGISRTWNEVPVTSSCLYAKVCL